MKDIRDGLLTLYSVKEDGNMSKNYSSDALQNKRGFLDKHGIVKEDSFVLAPSNSDTICFLDDANRYRKENWYDNVIASDCVICMEKNVMLYLAFGDCIPFTLYDKKKHIFAFAHLGWKSVYLNLHEKVVDYFLEHLDSGVCDLVVIIGPSIKAESYVFDDTVQAHDPAWRNFVYHGADGYHVDLCGYVKHGLIGKGILDEHIVIDPIDTGQDFNFFSNYRTQHNGEEAGRFFYGSMML